MYEIVSSLGFPKAGPLMPEEVHNPGVILVACGMFLSLIWKFLVRVPEGGASNTGRGP